MGLPEIPVINFTVTRIKRRLALSYIDALIPRVVGAFFQLLFEMKICTLLHNSKSDFVVVAVAAFVFF